VRACNGGGRRRRPDGTRGRSGHRRPAAHESQRRGRSDYFADGLTDEIIRNLAAIDGLEVRSRTSSFSFRDKPRNLRDVGSRLGATHVVEGSVLRDGRRLRIIAQLVRVDGDVPLWSERFDRELEDVFAVQEEISRASSTSCGCRSPGQRRYDTDVELYDLYLKARGLLETRQIGQEARDAAKLFEEVSAAIRRLPPHTRDWQPPTPTCRTIPMPGRNLARPARACGRRRSGRCSSIRCCEAHAAMGWMHAREFDWPNAERSFERALELNRTLTPISINYVYSTLRAWGSWSTPNGCCARR